MMHAPILESVPGAAPPAESRRWLARAAQARRIAALLSYDDAQIALAHALDCEREATQAQERRSLIAA